MQCFLYCVAAVVAFVWLWYVLIFVYILLMMKMMSMMIIHIIIDLVVIVCFFLVKCKLFIVFFWKYKNINDSRNICTTGNTWCNYRPREDKCKGIWPKAIYIKMYIFQDDASYGNNKCYRQICFECKKCLRKVKLKSTLYLFVIFSWTKIPIFLNGKFLADHKSIITL